MPRYDHRCESCSHEQITEYSIKEEPYVPCDVCGGTTKRIISKSTGFVLQGDDWHRDGYGTKHKKG